MMARMRKLLSRFSFTFILVGGLLMYYVYTSQTQGPRLPEWQAMVIVVGGALSIAMGARGLRERHRQED